MDFKDYYSTLGVAKTATEKEIKQAFRKLARKFHPDVNPGDKAAEARFKEINEANEVLSDADKRRKYDELERLRQIKHFVDEAGVNLAGVQRLLAIADVVRDMQSVTDGEQSPRSQLRKLSDDLRRLTTLLEL